MCTVLCYKYNADVTQVGSPLSCRVCGFLPFRQPQFFRLFPLALELPVRNDYSSALGFPDFWEGGNGPAYTGDEREAVLLWFHSARLTSTSSEVIKAFVSSLLIVYFLLVYVHGPHDVTPGQSRGKLVYGIIFSITVTSYCTLTIV